MSEEIETAREYLRIVPNNSVSVLRHVGEVYNRLADFGPDRPIDFLEPFSYLVKEERENKPTPLLVLHDHEGPDFKEAARQKNALHTKLFARKKLTAEGEEEEEEVKEPAAEGEDEEAEDKTPEEETQNEGEIPNVLGEMQFVTPAGIGLGQREVTLLQRSIEKLVRSKPLAKARFWGKVMGIDRDYYVAEVEFNDGERPHKEPSEEEEKQETDEPKTPKAPIEEDVGPNLNNYFVCTTLGGKWSLLPDVTPQQIVASRSIRQRFTGNLDAEVHAPPGRFEGTERDLLRTFIARLVQTCTIAPKGQYNPEDEPEEDVPLESTAPIALNEEWVPKPVTGLGHFLHRLPAILPQGRTEFWSPEGEEEDKNRVIEKGPPILRPLTLDEPIDVKIPSWTVKILQTPAKLFWLRSNAWPGLSIVTSANADKLVMQYYGWGCKSTPPLEWPPLPEPKPKPPPPSEEEEEEEEGAERKGDEDDGSGRRAKGGKKGAASESGSGTYDASSYDGY
jgi:radial spoke head protein 4A